MTYPANTVSVAPAIQALSVTSNVPVVAHATTVHVTAVQQDGEEITVRRPAVLVYTERIVLVTEAVSPVLLILSVITMFLDVLFACDRQIVRQLF